MRNASLLLFVLLVTSACDRLPGKPQIADRYERPSQVKDFAQLYGGNCAGCHGDDQRPGASVALSDPVYLAFADDASIRRATSAGVAGTSMPPFARSNGGSLTDAQIDTLVSGMKQRWGHADAAPGAPPYAAPPGDATRGARAYATYCASCHGNDGKGSPKGGSVVDGSYLALVSDQGLRTAVVVGRPRLGMPDWRGAADPQGRRGTPMAADDVADVVAWLASKRAEFPGQPYAAAR